MKIFLSKKSLDKFVKEEINKLITTQRNSVLESAVYYADLLKENAKLKKRTEEQAKIINAIKILKEVLK